MNRVLVVDDDVELCELVSTYLVREGFAVDAVHRGDLGATRALTGEYTLVVLDVMLPGLDGFEVLRRIRAASSLPVVMLTARGEEVDRIVGLEIGADDYLPKPFSPRELTARIRAILRRARNDGPKAPTARPTSGRIHMDDIELDGGAREVRCQGALVELTAAEFDLLDLLLRAAGEVVTREEMARDALGRPLMPYERSIDVHISNLRKKLGLHRDGRERIKTVRSIGYVYAHSAAGTEPAGTARARPTAGNASDRPLLKVAPGDAIIPTPDAPTLL